MNKKELGAFYTPGHTVDYILSQVNNTNQFNRNSKILEPSGGDGIFISHLINSYNVEQKNIDVRDINYEVKEKILNYGVNFTCKDSLLENNIENSLFSQETGYYTHIIGNPPYLNKQSDYIKSNKNKLKKSYENIGVHDTYAMFIYMGCKLLTKGGCLGFIVSDTFLTLGIHKNFRKFLLEGYTIKEITLCPKNLFEGANVNTCIIIISNNIKNKDTTFIINDCRNCKIGDYNGIRTVHNQNNTLEHPDYVFDINNNSKFLEYAKNNDKLINYVYGGLGMHTKDNNRYLAIINYNGINYNGINYAKKKSIGTNISFKEIDNKNRCFYHKQGGNYKYYTPAEYAVKWDTESIKNYVIPKDAIKLKDKQGFIISGVCSYLCARLSTKGAMRESNKAMCFFPKDEKRYPCEYFLGLLNSSTYNKIIKSLNHTNSIQIRDIYKLPMIHLNDEDKLTIITIVKDIINKIKSDINYDFSIQQNKIDTIIEKYFFN